MKKKWLASIILVALVSTSTSVFADEIQSNSGNTSTSAVSDQSPSLSKARISTKSIVPSPILPISNPDSNYVSTTTKFDISRLSQFSEYGSVNDSSQTVQFSSPLTKITVGYGWATWSSPPSSESSNPDVLYSTHSYSLSMNLTRPVTTFGFEFEPDQRTIENFTVNFYTGTTLLGSINKDVNGNGGAQLFAAKSLSTPIDRIEITGSDLFAIGQIRYSLAPVDNTAPVTNAALSFSPTGFKVALTATDDRSGVAQTEYSLNGGAWTVYSSPITLQGGQKLQYRSIDKAGNIENEKTLGTVDSGFVLENVYLTTPFGTIGPINTTLNSAQDLVKLILSIPNR